MSFPPSSLGLLLSALMAIWSKLEIITPPMIDDKNFTSITLWIHELCLEKADFGCCWQVSRLQTNSVRSQAILWCLNHTDPFVACLSKLVLMAIQLGFTFSMIFILLENLVFRRSLGLLFVQKAEWQVDWAYQKYQSRLLSSRTMLTVLWPKLTWAVVGLIL